MLFFAVHRMCRYNYIDQYNNTMEKNHNKIQNYNNATICVGISK